MQQQIIFSRWIEIEGFNGTAWIPFDLVYGNNPNRKTMMPPRSDVQDYYDGKIISTSVVDGYGARLSMPGYLDCTDWTVFRTQEEAQEYLNNTYADE